MNPNTVRLYHNPSCSKSRAALAWLEERELPVEIIDYLGNPPTRSEWQILMQALDLPSPAGMMRTEDPLFTDLGLNIADPATVLLDALTRQPQLLQRPIVLYQGRAAIGRPTENIAALFT